MKTRVAVLFMLLLGVACGAQDYEPALPGYQYHFPRDHFSHTDYQTEWWYYTGNLKAADGHRFGFELTFFRQGISRDANTSAWAVRDLYMAHLALSDISAGRFYHSERINRAGPGIAGIDENSSLIWNGNWQAQLGERRHVLRGVNEKFKIELELAPAKPPVVHGRDGISQKAEGSGHASHYVSFTRLLTSGSIEVNGTMYKVDGMSWMDHEFFTESLDKNESGWDWLSLQLDDKSELMLYRLRHKDGSVDEYSSGTFVDAQGKNLALSSKDFMMTSGGETWTSEQSKGRYPVRWHVSVPRLGFEIDVSTPLVSQELSESIGPSYWEGAIDVAGQRSGGSVRGVGYLEMTGYAAPLLPGGVR
jgi:predicted secreted hydrolase